MNVVVFFYYISILTYLQAKNNDYIWGSWHWVHERNWKRWECRRRSYPLWTLSTLGPNASERGWISKATVKTDKGSYDLVAISHLCSSPTTGIAATLHGWNNQAGSNKPYIIFKKNHRQGKIQIILKNKYQKCFAFCFFCHILVFLRKNKYFLFLELVWTQTPTSLITKSLQTLKCMIASLRCD